jgi:predicted enzyme related to lactoylglutathione lyase
MAYPVTHFEINARDAKAQQKFYGDVFGWRIDANNPQNYGMAMAQDGARGINGGIGASQDGRSWVTFYVESPDMPGTLAKVERLGGRTVMPPTDAGMVTFALFADPEGNVVGLASMPEPPRRSTTTGRKKTVAKRKTATTKKVAAKKTTKKKTTARKAAKRR